MQNDNKKSIKIRDKLPKNLIIDKYQIEIAKRQKFNQLQNFSDPHFKHGYSSLVNSDYNALEYQQQFESLDIVWYRAHEIFPQYNYDVFRGITATDVIQGQLQNCYLMSSIACLAEHPELVKRLFDLEQANLYGVYSIWLNINGLWQQIILDDYFPCVIDKSNKKSFLGCSNNDNELWVLLIEKAYAKVHGSYWAISRGNPIQTLRDLTGAPFRNFNLEAQEKDKLKQIWNNIFEADNMSKLIITGTKSIAQGQQIGLRGGHAYSILDVKKIIDSQNNKQKILKIRNPYGNFEWKGDFSDDSDLWTNELRRQLTIEVKNDGIFWMKYEDFIQYFDYVGILDIDADSFFYSRKIHQEETNQNLLKIKIEKKGKYIFSIDQISQRFIHNKNYDNSFFRMTLFKYENKNFQFIDTKFEQQQSIFLECNLDQGEYFMLIETQWTQDIVREFTFGYYSKYLVQYEEVQIQQNLIKEINYFMWKKCIEQDNFEYHDTCDMDIQKSKNQAIKLKEFKLDSAYFCVFDNRKNDQVCYLKLKYDLENSYLLCEKHDDQYIEVVIDKNSIEYIASFDKAYFEETQTFFDFEVIQRKFIPVKKQNKQKELNFFFDQIEDVKKQQLQFGCQRQRFDMQKLTIEFREKQLREICLNDDSEKAFLQKKLSSTVQEDLQKKLSSGVNEDLQRKLSSTVNQNKQQDMCKSQPLQTQKIPLAQNLNIKRKKSINQINHINYKDVSKQKSTNQLPSENQKTYQQYKNYQFSQNKQKQIPVYGSQQQTSFQQPVTQNFINNVNILKQDSFNINQRHMRAQNQQMTQSNLINKNRFVQMPYKYTHQRTKPEFEYQSINNTQDFFQSSQMFYQNDHQSRLHNLYESQMSNCNSQMSKNSGINRSNMNYQQKNSMDSTLSFDFSQLSQKSTLRNKKLAPFLINKKGLKNFVDKSKGNKMHEIYNKKYY